MPKRKFLIKLETEFEPIDEGQDSSAWAEGRWGLPFVSSEDDFDCYGPYCANYLKAINLVNEQMPNLIVGVRFRISCKLTSSAARSFRRLSGRVFIPSASYRPS